MAQDFNQNVNPYEAEKKSEKASWGNAPVYITVVVLALIFIRYLDPAAEQLGISTFLAIPIEWILLIVFFFLGILLKSVGRLVMGLLTGYKTLVFCVGPIGFVRENGRLVFKPLPVMFWAGQCLMTPKPVSSPEEVRYFWYHFGGVFFDILAAASSFAVLFVSDNIVVKWIMSNAFIAFVMLVMIYLIPSDKGAANNGMVLKRLKNDPQARLIDHNILVMTGMEYEGVKAADMPQELFVGADVNGASPYCDIAVLKASKLVASGEYREAKQMLDQLICNENVQRNIVLNSEVRCKLAYCIMVLGEDLSSIDSIIDQKTLQSITMASAYSITKLRFLYTYYLTVKHDPVQAQSVYEKAVNMRESCVCLAEYEAEMAAIEKIRANANNF